jgi:organic anion transporter 3A
MSLSGTTSSVNLAARTNGEYAEVTVVPVATAGPCNSSCHTIYPFLILLFFMTFIVAITQMPLLMIVLRCVATQGSQLGLDLFLFLDL